MDAERKNLCVYPYGEDFAAVLRQGRLLRPHIEVSRLVSPAGWGLVGESIPFCRDGAVKNLTVTSSLGPDLEGSTVFVPPFPDITGLEEKIVDNIIGQASQISSVILSAKLHPESLQRLAQVCAVEDLNTAGPDEMAMLDPEARALREIGTPVIAVCGLWESMDKFEVSLILRQKFLDAGYAVSQIGSRNYSEMFGFHSFPRFMFDPSLGETAKVFMFNQYIQRIEEQEAPDVIIMGIPGETHSFSDKVPGRFGILPFIASKAVLIDCLLYCTCYNLIDSEFLETVSQSCFYRLGCEIDAFHVSGAMMDLEQTRMKGDWCATALPQEKVNLALRESAASARIFNALWEEDADRLFEKLIETLAN